jgi:hypothetical protein
MKTTGIHTFDDDDFRAEQMRPKENEETHERLLVVLAANFLQSLLIRNGGNWL